MWSLQVKEGVNPAVRWSLPLRSSTLSVVMAYMFHCIFNKPVHFLCVHHFPAFPASLLTSSSLLPFIQTLLIISYLHFSYIYLCTLYMDHGHDVINTASPHELPNTPRRPNTDTPSNGPRKHPKSMLLVVLSVSVFIGVYCDERGITLASGSPPHRREVVVQGHSLL